MFNTFMQTKLETDLLQVAVITLTSDLQSHQHLTSVLHPQADYQVIPGTSHMITVLTNKLMEVLVQESK